MAEEKNGNFNCGNDPLSKALKVTVILFLVYIMLGGLFMAAVVAFRGHNRAGIMKRGIRQELKENGLLRMPCSVSTESATPEK